MRAMVDNCCWKWGSSLQTVNGVQSIFVSMAYYNAAISPISNALEILQSCSLCQKTLAHWPKGHFSFIKHVSGKWHFGHFLQIHVFRPVTKSFECRLVLQYFRCVSNGHCCLVLGGHEYDMSSHSIYFVWGLVNHRWLHQKEAVVLFWI